MHAVKPVGRGAAAKKYDLLTAMGAYALASDKGTQRLILRLMTLITARYNWARDELAVGQREIARLWGCDERTVKREMAKLRARGWLTVRRQGARGRVTEYALAIERVLEETRPVWGAVGPDFELRMEGAPAPSVVPLPVRGEVPAPDVSEGHEWALAQAVLHAEDAPLYAAWVRALRREGRAGGRLMLSAPSRFHAAYVETHLKPRLLTAVQAVDADVSEIVVAG
jgi:DNA-binding MarR family transcriptional regulator